MIKNEYCVSVVIRTGDIEKYFYELLWKLSSQTLRPSELVIVDNFSSKKKLNDMVNLLLLIKKNFLINKFV